MSVFLIVFAIALTITGASTPLIRNLAVALGFVDAPASRKLHKAPVPLMGGVAIFGGAIIAFLLIFVFTGFYKLTNEVVGILIAISIMAAVGLLDDRLGDMSAAVKLGGQMIAVVVLIFFGVYVQLPVPMIVNYAITFLWFLILSNAVNFLDNMDGACAGISGVAAAFVVLMAAINGQELVAALAAAVLGSTLGFLRYNFNPAKIFMGDAGSLFLGFLLAILTLELQFPENSNFVTWMVPLFIMGVPLFDLSLVFISRVRRGVNPLTTAGKDHTGHRLVEFGLSQREAVLILYIIGGIFGMIALYITQATILEGYFIGASVILAGMFGIYRLEWRRRKSPAQQQTNKLTN